MAKCLAPGAKEDEVLKYLDKDLENFMKSDTIIVPILNFIDLAYALPLTYAITTNKHLDISSKSSQLTLLRALYQNKPVENFILMFTQKTVCIIEYKNVKKSIEKNRKSYCTEVLEEYLTLLKKANHQEEIYSIQDKAEHLIRKRINNQVEVYTIHDEAEYLLNQGKCNEEIAILKKAVKKQLICNNELLRHLSLFSRSKNQKTTHAIRIYGESVMEYEKCDKEIKIFAKLIRQTEQSLITKNVFIKKDRCDLHKISRCYDLLIKRILIQPTVHDPRIYYIKSIKLLDHCKKVHECEELPDEFIMNYLNDSNLDTNDCLNSHAYLINKSRECLNSPEKITTFISQDEVLELDKIINYCKKCANEYNLQSIIGSIIHEKIANCNSTQPICQDSCWHGSMKYLLSLSCAYFTNLSYALYRAGSFYNLKEHSDRHSDYVPELDISKELEDLKCSPRWDLAKRSFECPATLFSDASALSANANTTIGIC